MTADPIVRFQRWFDEARKAGARLPESMALATADASGRPSVRYVLLKQGDASGFVFFSNAASRKGHEIHGNQYGALAFYWDELGKQVRIEGRIDEMSAAAADVYWGTRPRASQLAAVASRQSAPVASRSVLVARWKSLSRRYAGKAVPRPEGWLGYRLIPDAIEFWTRHEHRLHHRELFVRTRRGWKLRLLQP